jgi:hypothetical protein
MTRASPPSMHPDRVCAKTVGLDFFEKRITLRGDTGMKLQVGA